MIAYSKPVEALVTGAPSRARAGKFGAIMIAWYNAPAERWEMRAAEIGVGDGSDGKLKADTWYQLGSDGAFFEVTE